MVLVVVVVVLVVLVVLVVVLVLVLVALGGATLAVLGAAPDSASTSISLKAC